MSKEHDPVRRSTPSPAAGRCRAALDGSARPGARRSSSRPRRSTPPKLAITDTEVTVGQLHSATGTMAISETGSIQAEQLAIDQINAMGGILGRKIKVIKEDGASDWPTFAEKSQEAARQRPLRRPCSAAGPRRRARPCCRSSRKRTACSTTRPSTKDSSSRRTSSTPARKPRSRSSTASTGRKNEKKAKTLLPDRLRLHLAAHLDEDRAQAHRELPEGQGRRRRVLPAGQHQLRLADEQDQAAEARLHLRRRGRWLQRRLLQGS